MLLGGFGLVLNALPPPLPLPLCPLLPLAAGILVTGALWPALVSQPLKRHFLRRFEAPLKHIF